MLELNIGNEKSKLKFAILGIPWDGGASLGRPGSRYAPGKVRKALNWILNRIQDNRLASIEKQQIINLEKVHIRDFGNVEIIYHNFLQTFDNITVKALDLLSSGFIPLCIGGDHSITFPLIKALQKHSSKNIGIIQMDAHLDLVDYSLRQGKFSHSSEIRRALELDGINSENLVQVGVRGFNYPDDFEFVKSKRIKQFTPHLIRSLGIENVADKSLRVASEGTEKIYMTVDIDVMDPSIAPGCGANEPGGLTVTEVESFIDELVPNVDFFDITEVNPVYDVNDITSSIAAKLLADFIVSRTQST